MGRVTNITDYGAFVELEPGIEGLVHVSEMSWTKKNVHPGKIVSTSSGSRGHGARRRRAEAPHQPGAEAVRQQPLGSLPGEPLRSGSELEGEIKNITEFGLFVGLPGEIDGMVHLSDLDWNLSGEEAVKQYEQGRRCVKVKVLDVDVDKERVSLGIKQLGEDPFAGSTENLKKGDVVTVHGAPGRRQRCRGAGRRRRHSASSARRSCRATAASSSPRPLRGRRERSMPGSPRSTRKTRKIALSIKQREAEEEKQAMADYGSTESGASLGDILGAALSKAAESREGEEAKPAKKAASKSKAAAADAEEAPAEDAKTEDGDKA